MVKKDVPLNEGFPESELVSLVTPYEAKTPLHIFSKLVDEDLMEHLTFETSRFRVQNDKSKVKPIRIDEIRKFLGIILYMSVVCLPFRRMYSSRLLRQAHVADSMPRNRFDEIISLFHAANNDDEKKKGQDRYDRLYRVRPVLQRLNKNFLNAAEMEPCLAVDEMIIPFKGQEIILHDTTVKKENPPSNKVSLEHIKKACELDAKNQLKLLPHLKLRDLDSSHFEKTNVATAHALFHHAAAAGLRYLVHKNHLPEEALTTAFFLGQVFLWFTIMTSRTMKTALSELCPQKGDEVKYFLITFIGTATDMVIVDRTGKSSWKPFKQLRQSVKCGSKSVGMRIMCQSVD
ncbi:hypothetical protein MRX96_028300 [Rhipicephalus microplus]